LLNVCLKLAKVGTLVSPQQLLHILLDHTALLLAYTHRFGNRSTRDAEEAVRHLEVGGVPPVWAIVVQERSAPGEVDFEHRRLARVTDACFTLGGGSAVYETSPLQRQPGDMAPSTPLRTNVTMSARAGFS
jgi:hypothetical protein